MSVSTARQRQSSRTRFADIPIETIFPDPDQPRREISEEDVMSMADSIRAIGLTDPITLRLRPGTYRGYYIVAGETRYRACQRLGYVTIPSLVKEQLLDDDDAFEEALVSNLARNDMDPFDVAAALRRIFRARKLVNNSQLARIVGRKESWVGDRLLLNWLDDAAKAQVRRGEMTLTEAVAIAREVSGRTAAPRQPKPARNGARPAEPIRATQGFGSGRDPWHGQASPKAAPEPPLPAQQPTGRPTVHVPHFQAPGSPHAAPTPRVGDQLREMLLTAYRAGLANAADPDAPDANVVVSEILAAATRG